MKNNSNWYGNSILFKFILIVLIFNSCYLNAQKLTNGGNLNISGLVYDSLRLDPIALVKVYNLNKRIGTSTTFQGVFKLENCAITDSISFYAIGFERKILVIAEILKSNRVYLCPESQLVEEAIVLADKSILYELISKCKDKTTSDDLVSKTYIEVKSTNESKPVELIQGYYNGYFNGYNLDKIVTKNVRMGLQAKDARLYTSIRTTDVFYTHNLFEMSDLFPLNPLQLNKKKLKREYNVFLNSKFREEEKIIYAIGFSPIDKNSESFSGIIWIDSVENKIHKIILESKNAQKHPFDPVWNSRKLNNVDLKITKSFLHQNDTVRMNYVNFEYSINYSNQVDSSINIKTHASLQAYNYNDQFIEPYFNFPERKIWANHELAKLYVINYDTLFWSCQEEFKSSSDAITNNLFYNDSSTITGPMLYELEKFRFLDATNTGNLGTLFVPWNAEKRIFMKDLGTDVMASKNVLGAPPSQLYHLEGQIYLNINQVCDSVYFSTKTIYDPFKTFYRYPFTQETLIFINIYFDIVEIQRRKLELKLTACSNDVVCMKMEYEAIVKETAEISKKFFNEVNRGYNKNELILWNKYVVKNLNIDNVELFKTIE